MCTLCKCRSAYLNFNYFQQELGGGSSDCYDIVCTVYTLFLLQIINPIRVTLRFHDFHSFKTIVAMTHFICRRRGTHRCNLRIPVRMAVNSPLNIPPEMTLDVPFPGRGYPHSFVIQWNLRWNPFMNRPVDIVSIYTPNSLVLHWLILFHFLRRRLSSYTDSIPKASGNETHFRITI